MELRVYAPEDFEAVRGWIGDERVHALWCAGRFRFPLTRPDFERVLAGSAESLGEIPLIALRKGKAAGFFCYSLNRETREGKLRFVVLDPALRGKDLGKMLLRLAIGYAFGAGSAETLTLSVFPENVPALRCYESVGFRALTTEPGAFRFREETWGRCKMAIWKEQA